MKQKSSGKFLQQIKFIIEHLNSLLMKKEFFTRFKLFKMLSLRFLMVLGFGIYFSHNVYSQCDGGSVSITCPAGPFVTSVCGATDVVIPDPTIGPVVVPAGCVIFSGPTVMPTGPIGPVGAGTYTYMVNVSFWDGMDEETVVGVTASCDVVVTDPPDPDLSNNTADCPDLGTLEAAGDPALVDCNVTVPDVTGTMVVITDPDGCCDGEMGEITAQSVPPGMLAICTDLPGPTVIDITYTISNCDGSGTFDQDCTFMVDDTDPPTCVAPDATTVMMDVGACTVTIPDNTSTVEAASSDCIDNVTQDIVGTVAANCGDIITVEYSVEDCSGKVTTCTQDFTVIGVAQTAIGTCPLDRLVDVDAGLCEGTIPDLTGEVVLSLDCGYTITQDPVAGETFGAACGDEQIVTIEIICTHTDPITLAPVDVVIDMCDVTLTLNDNEDPVAVCPAAPPVVIVMFDAATCAFTTGTLAEDALGDGSSTDNCTDPPTETNPETIFTCSDVGIQMVTLTATDGDGSPGCPENTDMIECSVEVILDPVAAEWGPVGPLCLSDLPADLVALGAPVNPFCTWSGDYVSPTGIFDPSAAGPGVYSVTYTVGDPVCHVELTRAITVEMDPIPDLVDDFSVCLCPGELFDFESLLAAGSTEGGTFSIAIVDNGPPLSGTVITGDHYYNYLSGCGDLTVTYETTDCDGMVKMDDVVITIKECPKAKFDLPSDLCQDATPNPLDFTPYLEFSGCDDYEFEFTITPDPAAVCGGPLLTNPLTGTLADPPMIMIDPLVTPGTYQVTLVITDPDAICEPHTCHQVITIHQSGDPTWTNPGPLCEDAAFPIVLDLDVVLDDAGCPLADDHVFWYADPGVTDVATGTTGMFTPPDTDGDGLPGPGVFHICADVGHEFCEETFCLDVVIEDDLPDPVLVADFALCLEPNDLIDFNSLLLATDVTGGAWTVVEAGVDPGTIFPNQYLYAGGCGDITVTYTLPAGVICPAPLPADVVITFNEKPEIDIVAPGPLCVLDGVKQLKNNADGMGTGCAPEFGVFSYAACPGAIVDAGDGQTAMFDPAMAGEGLHVITYTSFGAAPCNIEETFEIMVFAASDPTFAFAELACEVDADIPLALTTADPSVLGGGGACPAEDGIVEVVWYGDPAVTDNGDGTGAFSPATAGPGFHLVCVQTGDAHCMATHCELIEVVGEQMVALVDGHIECSISASGAFDLNGLFDYSGTPAATSNNALGGTWALTAPAGCGNIPVGSSTLEFSTAGCYVVEYTPPVTAAACMALTVTANVYVSQQPQPSFDLAEEICWDGVTPTVTLTALVNSPEYMYECAPQVAAEVWTSTDLGVATVAAGVVTIVGPGTTEICLEETLANGAACGTNGPDACVAQVCHTLTVNDAPFADPSWTSFGPLCVDDAPPIDLTALVIGDPNGVFTGEGVSAVPSHPDYVFDPTAIIIPAGQTFKDVTICYTLNTPEGCTAVECHTVTVYAAPDATLFGDLVNNCRPVNRNGFVDLFDLETLFTATTTPHGTWTVLSSTTFAQTFGNQLDALPGCHEIEYTVSAFPGADGACEVSETLFLLLTEEPEPSFDMAEEVCWDGFVGSAVLPTLYNGFTFGSGGTLNFNWTVSTVSGPGPVPTITSPIIQEPTVTINGPGVFEICLTESIDYPACGSNVALPAQCSKQVCHILTVVETADAIDPTWAPFGPVCKDDAVVDLVPLAVTPNGEFTGEGVVEVIVPAGVNMYTFDPSLVVIPPGQAYKDVAICYTVDSSTGCTAVECHNIRVYGAVDATLADVHLQCVVAPGGNISLSSLFTSTTTTGGTFALLGGPATGIINGPTLTYVEAGCYEIEYTALAFDGADGCCMAVSSAFILISEEPQPSFDIQDQVCWSIGDVAPHTYAAKVNSPVYDAASILATTWSILSGPATVDAAGIVTITGVGNVMVCMEEELAYAACGTIPAGTCVAEFCAQIEVTDGTAQDCSFTIDNEEPCIGDVVNLVATTAGGIFTGVGVTDAGDGMTATFTPPACGTFAVTYTLNDPNGCSSVCTTNIITDQEAPVVTPPAAVTVECGTEDIPTWLATATAADNCTDPVTVTNWLDNTISGCGGTYTECYVFMSEDECGNVGTAKACYTIIDTTAPTIDAPAVDETVECNGGSSSAALLAWLSNNGGATATETCGSGSVIWTNDYGIAGNVLSDECALTGEVTVTFTAKDECDNAETTMATFKIEDTMDPMWDILPQDLTLECDGTADPGGQIASWLAINGDGIASDMCGKITYTNDYVALTPTCDVFTGSALVTFTATDECDNTAIATATVTVEDTTPPMVTCPPAVTGLMCGDPLPPALTAPADFGIIDDCSLDFTVALLSEVDNGKTVCPDDGMLTFTRTYEITDACGNASTCTQDIMYDEDNIPPTFFGFIPFDQTVECGIGDNEAARDAWVAQNEFFLSIGFFIDDNCTDDPDLVASSQIINTDSGCGNTWTEEWEFCLTDLCGNQTCRNAFFNVVDRIAPLISPAPAPDPLYEFVECDGQGNTADIQSWLNANGGLTATDECNSNITWTNNFDPANFVDFGCNQFLGQNVKEFVAVTFCAEDECGNVTPQFGVVPGAGFVARPCRTLFFIITDDTAPVALCKDIQVILDPATCGAGVTITGDMVDNGSYDTCSEPLTFTLDKDNFTCADVGFNTVVLTVTDDCGNSSTCMANVEVIDNAVETNGVMLMVCPDVPEQDSGTFTLEEAEDAAAASNGTGVAVNPGGGAVTYHISSNDAQAGINPLASPFISQTKTIYARVAGAAGCEDCFRVEQIWLTVTDSPDPDPQPWYEFCFKDLPAGAPIDGNPVGGTPPYITHIWAGPDVAILDDPTAAMPNVLPGTAPGLYKVTYQVIDSKGCISEEFTYIKILIHEAFGIMACTSTPVICEGKKIRLESDVMVGMEGVGPYTYAWEESTSGFTSTDQNPMISPSDPGYPTMAGTFTYSVTVTDDNDCTSTETVDVVVNEAPDPIDPADVVNTFYCPTSKATGTSPVKDTPINSSVLAVDCGATACDGFVYGGGPICDGAAAPSASASWYDVSTGGTPLFDADFDGDGVFTNDLDGDPATFDPVAAGLIDPWTPGVYTYYVSCSCAPCDECATGRVPVTLTILDCNVGEDECTYLVVLKDTGNDGWDGAFLNISIDEGPFTAHKVENCDINIIPITTSDGGIVDFDYCNGAKESEHYWCVLDVFGNIATDTNGNLMEYGPNPAVHEDVRLKLDCPEECNEEEEYKIVITMGDSPMDQSWELYNAKDSIIAWAGPGDYMGLAPGTVLVDTTLFLSSCDDLKFITYDGTGNGWAGGCWSIQGTNADRGTVVLGSDGEPTGCYEIAGSCGGFTFEDQTRFTIPCMPVDCPSTMTVFANDGANCQLTGFTPPFNPTPYVCYPNCGHASPAPVVTNNLGDPIPVGVNEFVYTITYADGQIVRCTAEVNVITVTNPTMVCNDNVNLSLLQPGSNGVEDCMTTVSPDDVLEAIQGCPGQYVVNVFDENGNDLGNVVGPEHAGSTLTYEVQHIGSSNKCWGTLTIEDKNAPIISCQDYEIACTHPNAMDENYCHDIVFNAQGGSVPKNIAGNLGSNALVYANLNCGPLGEIVKSISFTVDHTHTRPADLSVEITAPNGMSITTPIPTNQTLLNAFVGVDVSDLEGQWTIEFTDQSGFMDDNDDVGKGKIKNIEININAGFPILNSVVDCTYDGELVLINEAIVETDCDQSSWLGAKIVRTWQAIDRFGNSSTCVQEVGLVAPAFNDITFPGDIDLECGSVPDDPALITPDISGSFDFDCFSLENDQHSLCDVLVTYSDNVLPTCGKGYKIVRDFTILNCCNNTVKTHQQTIKVEDSTGPEFVVGDIEMSTGSFDCSTGSVIITPAVQDACSGVSSIVVEYTVGGGTYNNTGNLNIVDVTNGTPIPDLPFGMTQMMITAKDSCNNTTIELVDINVTDGTTPVAICDDNLNVSLNGNGLAWITAEDFDEGSSDNCGIATIEIRSLGCLGDEWASAAEISCCDVPSVTLELRVTDLSGNTNICWADITVEDPVAPVVTCKPDLTVDCNAVIDGGDFFTEPTATDICDVELINTVDGGSLDNCHAGTLTRTWTYSDGSDKSADASCTQRVTFVHVSDFTVQFPPDITIDTCPDDTGDTGAPIILDDDCELVAINFEDQMLSITDDASCFKIRRTWTLINWCVFDDSQTPTDGGIPLPLPNTFRDDDGYFQYIQEIKVIDEDAPTVTMEIPDPCDFTDGCEGFVELIAVGSDDCSTDLEYNYVVDAFSDGGSDITGTGDDASGVYPYGCHLITWNVGDNCGNWVSETFEFCVEDCKNPTPVCLNGISVEVMNDGDGCVSIPGAHLLEYAFDNCDEDEDIEASVLIRRVGDTGPPQTAIEVCCADVPGGIVNVEIWVTDSAGNSDFCETYIIPQDNLGNCPGSGGGSAAIKGDIVTEDFEDVDQVMVDINGSASANGITGEYFYPNLIVGSSYTVTPGKDIQPLNGVSTYDLVLISQHIIGTAPLTSPYQMIAADVNNSGSISTFDLVQLRQLILFVIADFPSNTSWRFVDMDYVFPVPTNPWSQTFPEFINVASLPLNGELLADFFAIKVGDVNGTANPNTLLGTNDREMPTTLVLNVDDTEMVAGETYRVDFLANDFTDINGYQFTMNFDRSVVEFVGTKGGALNVGEKNFGTTLLDEGVITTSFNEATAMTVENDETLFSVTFKAKVNASLSEVININSMYTPAESYNDAGEIMDVAIGFNTNNGLEIAGGAFELMQNKPNPFNEITVIGFNLPESAEVTLKIMNVAGKTLKVIKGDFERGYNETTFNRNDLDATGVLYYQLDTQGFTETKKMILID